MKKALGYCVAKGFSYEPKAEGVEVRAGIAVLVSVVVQRYGRARERR